ncbi:MAG: HipA domain-containing protein [Deltaproteobacteria bacterium]|nr:HipA domain-containing protein [Deltaproteobacteria bacterium]
MAQCYEVRAPEMADSIHLQRLLALLTQEGVVHGSSLPTALALSQPSVSRVVREAGDRVVRFGGARATRYAATRVIHARGHTLGHRWPLFLVRPDGAIDEAGELLALARDRWWIETADSASWLRSQEPSIGLPWPLQGLRPEGFLGRSYARRQGTASVPSDTRQWSDEDVLATLLTDAAYDPPGHWLVGLRARDGFEAARESAERPKIQRRDLVAYDRLAQSALAGEIAASSAGGEQPKFTTTVQDGPSATRHLLVKFAPRDNPAGQRWAELLCCEAIAAQVLRRAGIATCESEFSQSENYAFLEVTRFDRHGALGRSGVASLAALHGITGLRPTVPWSVAGAVLHDEGLVSPDVTHALRLIEQFGHCIQNTDMHAGNVSFEYSLRDRLTLAPVYDMLPMGYAPTSLGSLRMPTLALAAPPLRDAVWAQAIALGQQFWELAAHHPQLSPALRAQAETNALTLTILARG